MARMSPISLVGPSPHRGCPRLHSPWPMRRTLRATRRKEAETPPVPVAQVRIRVARRAVAVAAIAIAIAIGTATATGPPVRVRVGAAARTRKARRNRRRVRANARAVVAVVAVASVPLVIGTGVAEAVSAAGAAEIGTVLAEGRVAVSGRVTGRANRGRQCRSRRQRNPSLSTHSTLWARRRCTQRKWRQTGVAPCGFAPIPPPFLLCCYSHCSRCR